MAKAAAAEEVEEEEANNVQFLLEVEEEANDVHFLLDSLIFRPCPSLDVNCHRPYTRHHLAASNTIHLSLCFF